MPNHLINALSPYLLQHKDNPVEWYPWGNQAFEHAKERDIPIFLSIGYAACHWCHVMAHESFSDTATAEFLNKHFISIKVDREERPDIDAIYMDALLRMQGSGGWPMSMFLTPNGEPFFGGTYFPLHEKYGMITFLQLLRNIQHLWETDKEKIFTLSDEIKTLQTQSQHSEISSKQPHLDLNEEVSTALSLLDPEQGGLKGAPKFPQIPLMRWLTAVSQETRDTRLKQQLYLSAEKLCRGGIYDHIGGGWMRYSTDKKWHVPHFEKMLYDNAVIMQWLCDIVTDRDYPLYERRISLTIHWLETEMLQPNGLFSASVSADSEGMEGKFYVWQKSEIENQLSDQSADFCKHYNILDSGNWEGVNILDENHANFNPANEFKFKSALEKLESIRDQRVHPDIDDKIVTDWNALLISAITQASFTFEHSAWLTLAKNAFDKLEQLLCKTGEWYHCYRNNLHSDHGFLEDYAAVIDAALILYAQTANKNYLDKAIQWTEWTENKFKPSQNALFNQTDENTNPLYITPSNLNDHATPSGNGLMALNYVKLFWLTDDTNYQKSLEKLCQCINQEKSYQASSLYQAKLMFDEGALIKLDFNKITQTTKLFLKHHNGILSFLVNQPNASKITICKKGSCVEYDYNNGV